MNILIVDDEEVLQDVLTALIRQEGHHPICCASGQEALSVLAQEEIDLVLIFRPSGQAGPFVTEAAARPERPAIWLQTGIRADEEVGAARADGLTVIQDMCAFRVHRALF